MRRSEPPVPAASGAAALLVIPALILAACAHDWDNYAPRLDGGGGGGGGAGGSCENGLTPCEGGCVDTEVSAAHCGECGNTCEGDEVCAGGACQSSCGVLEDCGGACVDTTIDPQNCGRCGVVCAPGEGCSASRCAPLCGAGEEYCDGSCADTQSDPTNCGDCGTVCGLGDACAGGSCMCTGLVCGLCDIQDLGSAAPQTTGGDTVGAPDVVEPSCVPPGAGEVVFAFTAPSDGVYSIDTFGSGYDTTLVVLDLGCDEIACNDDVDDDNTDSLIFLNLAQQETVLIVVDGYEGEEGDFTLHIQPAGSPAHGLGCAVPAAATMTAGSARRADPIDTPRAWR